MPQVVVLGSGTSNGVPTPPESFEPSFLTNPKNFRTRPAIVLQGPEGNILVDFPPELRLQLCREQINTLEGAFLTHSHADHLMGMDDLRPFCLASRKPMPIYTGNGYEDDVRRVFGYAFAEFPPGIEVPRFELRPVEEFMNLAGMKIETFWVQHGPIPVLALRVGDFAYITDVSHIEERDMDRLHNLKNLILDGVRYRPHPNHYHYEKAIEVAQRIGAEMTYLTHLSSDYDHDKVNAELPKGIQLAFDGLRIPIHNF